MHSSDTCIWHHSTAVSSLMNSTVTQSDKMGPHDLFQFYIIAPLLKFLFAFYQQLLPDLHTMQSSEVTGIQYLLPSNPTQYMAGYQLNRFSNSLYQFQMTPQFQEFNPQIKCLSGSSTSDEADEQNIINERKQRRMISNRESARRSRMRKQKHLDELWSQVVWLRNENRQLIDTLNHVSENHDRVLQENSQLKEEASELRQMLADMRLNSPFPILRDLDDDPLP
ncbi:basic leucine zipper 43-like [Olea europaea subsp. europaea]|uniref:Basic leucine zipper 43-like n=1 Tax=Olea europaea subsp. europaea TaxID=158383 RepID=A0A8S0V9H7_OLEEU|nr:basic leucine zipper 43-like [Olea europaea subsp. europaea]